MNTPKLPPLPKPDTHCFDEDTGKDVWSHSPEQMQAYALAAIKAQGVPDVATPGPWFVRRLERDGELRDCFVSAPDCQGFAYDAEILGDDEYRDDLSRKLADCELIVAAVNAYHARALASTPPAPQTSVVDDNSPSDLDYSPPGHGVDGFETPSQGSVVQQIGQCDMQIRVLFECVENGVTGTTSAPVKRVEWEDDGTLTAVLDYWPPPAPKQKPLTDEQSRELAEQHYVCSPWYDTNPASVIGSRQWCAYWDGWRAAIGIKGE